MKEIEEAVATPQDRRKATNAIVTARRAVSCLADWYLRRDGFAFCSDAPTTASRKMDILLARKIADDLTARVWKRLVIDPRNDVEHEYTAARLDEAEVAVEVARRSMQAMMAASDPRLGPCLFGSMSMSTSFGGDVERVEFLGWRSPSVLIAAFDEPAWIGIVLPEGPDRAVVRRVPFSMIDTATYSSALQTLEARYPRASMATSEGVWLQLATECGLRSPLSS